MCRPAGDREADSGLSRTSLASQALDLYPILPARDNLDFFGGICGLGGKEAGNFGMVPSTVQDSALARSGLASEISETPKSHSSLSSNLPGTLWRFRRGLEQSRRPSEGGYCLLVSVPLACLLPRPPWPATRATQAQGVPYN